MDKSKFKVGFRVLIISNIGLSISVNPSIVVILSFMEFKYCSEKYLYADFGKIQAFADFR